MVWNKTSFQLSQTNLSLSLVGQKSLEGWDSPFWWPGFIFWDWGYFRLKITTKQSSLCVHKERSGNELQFGSMTPTGPRAGWSWGLPWTSSVPRYGLQRRCSLCSDPHTIRIHHAGWLPKFQFNQVLTDIRLAALDNKPDHAFFMGAKVFCFYADVKHKMKECYKSFRKGTELS